MHGDGKKLRLRIRRRNYDLAVIGGELDCILEQVPNDLLVLRCVSRDVMRASAQVEMERQIARLRFRPANFHDVVDDFVSIKRPKS